jgi:hypothetical protein
MGATRFVDAARIRCLLLPVGGGSSATFNHYANMIEVCASQVNKMMSSLSKQQLADLGAKKG